MKTLLISLILSISAFAQVPPPGTNGAGAGDMQSALQEPANKPVRVNANGEIHQQAAPKPPTLEDLQTQVTQLQQQVAQKDQQIAAMQATITASQELFNGCAGMLADAELRAKKKP